jgi:hypothetical protein
MRLNRWLVAAACGVAVSGGMVYAQSGVAWRSAPTQTRPSLVAEGGNRTDGGYQFRGNVQVFLVGDERLTADAAEVTQHADGSRTVVLTGNVRIAIPSR